MVDENHFMTDIFEIKSFCKLVMVVYLVKYVRRQVVINIDRINNLDKCAVIKFFGVVKMNSVTKLSQSRAECNRDTVIYWCFAGFD